MVVRQIIITGLSQKKVFKKISFTNRASFERLQQMVFDTLSGRYNTVYKCTHTENAGGT